MSDSLIKVNIGIRRDVVRLAFTKARELAYSYHPELDALRFFAFLLVFMHHVLPCYPAQYTLSFFIHHPLFAQLAAAFACMCGMGLPLFFILSAFLIANILGREREQTSKIHVKNFLVRRALRIWPLYYSSLVVGFILAMQHHAILEKGLMATSAMFLGDVFICNFTAAVNNPISPMWSISVEEQFYLLFPLILNEAPNCSIRLMGIFSVSISLIYLFIEGSRHLSIDDTIWFNPLSQLIFLGTGIILASCIRSRPISIRKSHRKYILSLSLFTLFLTILLTDAKRIALAYSGLSVSMGYLLSACCCAGILMSIYESKWKFPKEIVYLGKISYGLYVFHIPVMRLTEYVFGTLHIHWNFILIRIIALPLIIGVSMLSYQYFESIFLRMKTRFMHVETSSA